ncbi:GMC family oxidoreductase [Martelella mangrovi]|uniref:Choline dehydrogenase-like flavoprotein n=1 Tax=Martelella mangrovi TaxID=1397477 RepID=A0ABV2ICR8_9HYPH
MTEEHYDALVIGSGASGSFAAKELTEQGLSVLLLEAGRETKPEDFDPSRKRKGHRDINIWERARATLKGQPVQARAAFFSEQFGHFFVNDRQNPYTTPKDAPFLWIRGQQGGGRLHSFGRVLLRWNDDDFNIRSRTGKGADWPFTYADLAPYYDEVETLLGLYGNTDNVESLPDGVYAAPAKLTPAEEQFREITEKRWPERRVVSWRYIAPDPERTPKPLRDALATGNLTVRYNTSASRILTETGGRKATGAEVIDRTTGKRETVRAGLVVVCASPVESVRLLLNSASSEHPQGLANSSGLLGRYFMDQLPCLAAGSFPAAKGWMVDDAAPTDPFYNPSGGIFIPRFGQDGVGDPNGDFSYQGSIGRMVADENAPARLSFFGFGRMAAHADNRITLDPQRKDAWGQPVPHIRCVPQAEDHDLLSRQIETMAELVGNAGGELEFYGSPHGLKEMGRGAFPEADAFSRFMFRRWFRKTMCMGAAIHESGGARMGASPEEAVLDPFNRSFDIPNLAVTDASAFPSSGTSGTTLTIMALTVRACRNLAADYKAGRL